MYLPAPPQSSQTNDRSFHESEDRFRKVFVSSSDALFITDAMRAEFLDANPRACQVSGYSRRELLHLSPGRILSWRENAIDGRQSHPPPEKAHADAFCRQKSGLAVSCEISACAVKFNQKPCILFSVRTSSQRQLAETLRKT